MMIDEPVIATKETLGSYDAIETAKPGEPLFPIQGGDPFGPPTVLFWADLARTAARAEVDPKKAKYMLRKASDAEQIAWEMQAYQRGEAAQAVKRAQYIETVDIDELEHDQAVRAARIHGAGRLNNIVGQMVEVAETLEALETCDAATAMLRNAVERLMSVAAAIEPRRERERT